MISDTRTRFTAELARIVDAASADPAIVGLVGFGSTADPARADEWSDHDIAVITRAGDEARYRNDLSWLPDSDRIALSVVDQHDGVTIVYDDGRVIEFGVATIEGFATWAGNAATVLIDRGGVAPVVERMLARPAAGDHVDVGRETRIALAKLLIGVGRARRGELLTADHNIRGEALDHLLRAWGIALPADRSRLDTLDPRRRFEQAHPALGARLADAVRHDPETAARTLLDLAEETLGARQDFPSDGADAIRSRLGWPQKDARRTSQRVAPDAARSWEPRCRSRPPS
jgi:hypothetical protein